jgi:hypothetical protein
MSDGPDLHLFNYNVVGNLSVSVELQVSEQVKNFVHAAMDTGRQVHRSFLGPETLNYAHFTKEFAPE